MAGPKRFPLVSLFTRFPNPPGSCKTRLVPALGPSGAARCQAVMAERILDTLLALGDIDVEVRYAYSPGTSSPSSPLDSAGGADDVHSAVDFWLSPRQAKHYNVRYVVRLTCLSLCTHRLRKCPRLKWREQPGGDLGRRMASTVAAAFEEGHGACIIVGGDIPGITAGHVDLALESLRGRDMVLGPAVDGGFYLVGVAKRQSAPPVDLERLFCPVGPATAIDWGTSAVLQQQGNYTCLVGSFS